jgi:hypothetical protein
MPLYGTISEGKAMSCFAVCDCNFPFFSQWKLSRIITASSGWCMMHVHGAILRESTPKFGDMGQYI